MDWLRTAKTTIIFAKRLTKNACLYREFTVELADIFLIFFLIFFSSAAIMLSVQCIKN